MFVEAIANTLLSLMFPVAASDHSGSRLLGIRADFERRESRGIPNGVKI